VTGLISLMEKATYTGAPFIASRTGRFFSKYLMLFINLRKRGQRSRSV